MKAENFKLFEKLNLPMLLLFLVPCVLYAIYPGYISLSPPQDLEDKDRSAMPGVIVGVCVFKFSSHSFL